MALKFLESACCAEFTVDVERKDQSGPVEKAIIYDRTTEEFFIQKRLAGHYANIVKRIRNGSRN